MTQKKEGRRYWLTVGAAFVAALALQFAGVAFVLPLLVLGLAFWRLPLPQQLSSVSGRALMALIFVIALLQLSALVQFFVWPSSNFLYVSALFAVFSFVGLFTLGRSAEPVRWFTRYDAVGLVAALIFAAPLLWMVRHDTVANIVSIAGLQSPDAGHHFEFIGDMMHDQHFDDSGYPKSFHLAVGYLQGAFVGSQDQLSWQANVLTFFAQYLLFGAMLAMSLGYLCVFLYERMRGRAVAKKVCGLLAIALALPLQVVILWPFVEHGFLNYFYLVSVLAVVCLFADNLKKQKHPSEAMICFVLLLLLAAALTWPLVVPAILLALGMMMWPLSARQIWPFLKRHKVAMILVALQLAPLVLQVVQPGTTSVNDQGDLRIFPVFLLSAGAVAAIAAVRYLPKVSQRVLAAGLVPFALLMGGILAMQLLLFGEPRYFAIKVALLLQALTLPLVVAGLFARAAKKRYNTGLLLALVLTPLLTVAVLLAASGKPFDDVRNLYRDQLGQVKPALYDHDVSEYTKLGKTGEINYFNSTVLHYNPENGKLYSHPFLPQVVQMMKYYRTTGGVQAFACHKLIFNNLAYGDFSEVTQRQLVTQVRTCAGVASVNGQKYYIITDKASLERVKATIGEMGEGRGIVYVGQ